MAFEGTADHDGQRLDVFLAAHLPGVDRVAAGALVRAGRVTIDGKPKIKPSTWLQAGDRVLADPPPPLTAEARPVDLALPILFADEHLVVVVKPTGMATHPGPGWWEGSAVNALLHHLPRWRPVGGIATPGIVHRLDRDTSGLLVFANGDAAHQALLDAMRERRILRRYVAIARGALTGEGVIDQPLARDPANPERVIVAPEGKQARTHWRSIAPGLLDLKLETGRNHQIRVHLAAMGHPVVGDPWYGDGEPGGMKLHAYQLGLAHPVTGRWLSFTSLPPWIGIIK
ncbi:MAG: rluD [Cyanobacteria bacterium RYN_339]|nr:rluD [Cyanobacteria bacterium RYN_339]